MFRLKKEAGRDFTVLCLADPQMHLWQWEAPDQPYRDVILKTIPTLVARNAPDLILVAGDIAYANHPGVDESHDHFIELMESFGIPWAFVFGNHDDQGGPAFVRETAKRYLKNSPNCMFEHGDPAMGCGNYVIAIEEGDRIVTAFVMMDSHDCCYDFKPYIDENGVECVYDASFNDLQRVWYKQQIEVLGTMGCTDAALFMHIPFWAFNDAYRAAYRDPSPEGLAALQIADTAAGAPCWNPGYEDSFGVMHESISTYGHEDGIFDLIRETGMVRHVFVGHDHFNNWSIPYQGVRLTYITKCVGEYSDPDLNGGTVIRIGENGIADFFHDYVDLRDIYKY